MQKNFKNVYVECTFCKSHMVNIDILEKSLEDATKNKFFEKLMFKEKDFNKKKCMFLRIRIKIKELVGYRLRKEQLILGT